MIELLVLLLLVKLIGDMALRRGRSPSLSGFLLVVCFLSGESAGAVLGHTLSGASEGWTRLGLIYGLALAGAGSGAAVAFLAARWIGPVDGVWREPSVLPVQRSRLRGGVAGGLGGGILGALAAVLVLHEGPPTEAGMIAITGFLITHFVGALLGLVSGLQKQGGLV